MSTFYPHAAVQRCLLAAALLLAACEPGDFGPLLDIPISPAVGKVRSPSFRIYKASGYRILIGLDSMQVDDATCKAATGLKNLARPCTAILPAVGAFTWSVKRSGKVIAQGLEPAMPSPILGMSPADWAQDKKMSWLSFSGVDFYGEPGTDYIVEVDMQPAAVSLEPFHPRLAVMKIFKL